MTAALVLAGAIALTLVVFEVARRAFRSETFRRGFRDGINRNEETR